MSAQIDTGVPGQVERLARAEDKRRIKHQAPNGVAAAGNQDLRGVIHVHHAAGKVERAPAVFERTVEFERSTAEVDRAVGPNLEGAVDLDESAVLYVESSGPADRRGIPSDIQATGIRPDGVGIGDGRRADRAGLLADVGMSMGCGVTILAQ